MKLKICKIESLDSARDLVAVGVDFLGFHVLDESKEQYRERSASINRKLRDQGFDGGVFLTKSNNLDWTISSAQDGAYELVQLHSDASMDYIKKLSRGLRSEHIKLIQVVNPAVHDSSYITSILDFASHVLYDNYYGGTGEPVSIDDLDRVPMDRAFVAGGINDRRAEQVKDRYSPYAIDVQSWVTPVGDLLKGHKLMDRVSRLVAISGANK
jgi:phosphoribosylanthranilate isomerase